MANQLLTSPIFLAILIGTIPSLIWLFFWLRLSRNKPEPFGLLLLCFIIGGSSVFLATFIQQGLKDLITGASNQIIAWAAVEEIIKFGVFYIVAYKSDYDNEAIDPSIYLITVALGFAALENIFYILKPGLSFNVTASILTGGLRFFGATLLHAIASCFIGIMISLTSPHFRSIGIFLGLAGAIFLHATFNFFILKNDTASFLQVYGYLWVAAIISHVILEKLRRVRLPEQFSHI